MAKILDSQQELLWLEQARNGQAEAFGYLYDAYIKKIYDFIFYKTMNRDVAEDISADVFMKAWKNIKSFQPKNFSAWLYTIARHAIIDHYRRQCPQLNIDDYWDLSDNSQPAEDVDKHLNLEKIKRALKDLKVREREIIIMRLWLDLPFAEIASQLEQKEGAIKMAFSRALYKLKDRVPLEILIIGPALSQLIEKIYE